MEFTSSAAGFFLTSLSGGFGAMCVDAVTFDHPVERLAIDVDYPRRRLFVAVGVIQNPRHVTSFDDSERGPLILSGREIHFRGYALCRFVAAHSLGQILQTNRPFAHRGGAH